jgi:hypothetical protein
VACRQGPSPKIALSPLLLYACLRVNGLMFLMPGLVSQDLPRAFAVPTAYGDLAAAVLALLALWPLRAEKAAATPMVWIFNIEGMLDLIYANISTFKDHVEPTSLGVFVLPCRSQRAGDDGSSRCDFRLFAYTLAEVGSTARAEMMS